MKHKILLIVMFMIGIIYPCTTAIISGKVTIDGRPLLLKNRDTDELQNKLVIMNGNYRFIGLVNSADKTNSEVWVGHNSTGFAIMNSASYNLKGNDTTKLADNEGRIMRLALEECASLEDFEALLSRLPKPLGVEANFGVIDAQGGAAYYEVNNFHFIKFDVNDPAVAPNGYLIRTNYSFSGAVNKGMGYIRYATAEELFKNQQNNGNFSFNFLINEVPRCLKHSLTNQDLQSLLPETLSDSKYVFFRDYIPRYLTSSAIVVQGVKLKEDPALTTMWTILGFPLTSVIIPVWITEEASLPGILSADETGNAPLSTRALELKKSIFPVQNDAKENYLNLAALMNKENSGIRQKLIPVEEEILKRSAEYLERWRTSGINFDEVADFYKWIDVFVPPELDKTQGL